MDLIKVAHAKGLERIENTMAAAAFAEAGLYDEAVKISEDKK